MGRAEPEGEQKTASRLEWLSGIKAQKINTYYLCMFFFSISVLAANILAWAIIL